MQLAAFLPSLLVLVSSSGVAAQDRGASPGPAPIAATGAFAAISVRDLAASVRWYSETFAMHVAMTVPKQDKVAATVLEGSGLIVELIQDDDAMPLATAAPAVKERVMLHGLVKAGVIVADFERTLALLKSRGVDIAYGPYPARADQRANVIIRDNEGNLLQVFGPRL